MLEFLFKNRTKIIYISALMHFRLKITTATTTESKVKITINIIVLIVLIIRSFSIEHNAKCYMLQIYLLKNAENFDRKNMCCKSNV